MTKKLLLTIVIIVIAVLAVFFLFNRPQLSTTPDSTIDNSLLFSPDNSGFVTEPTLLTESSWEWRQTIMNNDTVITPIRPGAFILTFGADGSLSTTTDCNSGSGSYQATDDGGLTISTLAVTSMACIHDDIQESIYIRDLSMANQYLIDSQDNLILMLPVDSGSMIFTPLPLGTVVPWDTSDSLGMDDLGMNDLGVIDPLNDAIQPNSL
jgi:heat shock protein HslJ